MWEFKNPEYGDQIRVCRGLYYHHGIYSSNDSVYHFAAPGENETNSVDAKIVCTTLNEFLKGGNVEVRIYNDKEKLEKRKPSEIINYAKEHLGEGGYNLVTNNCEHFSNRCAFGKSDSEQVSNIFEMIAGMFL